MRTTERRLTLFSIIVGVLLLFLVVPAYAEDELSIAEIVVAINGVPKQHIHYLTPEQNAELNACEAHEPNGEEEETIANQAYTVFWCASYVRLVHHDYHRGWRLHKLGSAVIDQIPCECSLHNHADNMAYGTYLEVKHHLDTGKEITDAIIEYCDALTESSELDPEVSKTKPKQPRKYEQQYG